MQGPRNAYWGGCVLGSRSPLDMRTTFLLIGLTLSGSGAATHSLSGELQYEHLAGHTYRVTIHYYTCLSAPADRPELVLHYGDGAVDTVPRISIVDTPDPGCCGGVRYSTYVATHTYPGPGMFVLHCEDFNRSAGIANVPNSVAQSFCVEALLVIDDALGPNSSVRFMNSPANVEEVWSTLVHDPLPMEIDGDSLVFQLVTPNGLDCQPILGYVFPPSQPAGWHWIDPANGVFHWHLPPTLGWYTIAIRASEWRNGQLIGEVTRDMVICVPLSVMTGVEEHGPLTWSIAPNPAEDVLWIDTSDASPLELVVCDAQGRMVLQHRTAQPRTGVPVGNLAPGLYTLRDQHGRAQRFVKR